MDVGRAVSGFGMDYVRNVAEGRDYELPSWSDIGSQLGRGFLWSLATLVLLIPGFLIIIIGTGGSGALLGGAASAARSSAAGGLIAGFLMSVLVVLLLAVIYWFAVSILLRAMFAQYAMTRRFGSIFEFGDIFTRLKNGYWSAWILGILITWAFWILWFLVVTVLTAIPCIGWIVGLVLIPVGMAAGIMIGLMADHLLGQYAARAYGDLMQPSAGYPDSIPTPPPLEPSVYYDPSTVPLPMAPPAPVGVVPAAPGPPPDGAAAIAAALARTSADGDAPMVPSADVPSAAGNVPEPPEMPSPWSPPPEVGPSSLSGTLRVVQGFSVGSRWVLPRTEVFIGRDASCLVLIDDDRMSRRHARIAYEENGYMLSDLASTNGTFVSGTRVSGAWPLVDGDLIEIGDTVLQFALGN